MKDLGVCELKTVKEKWERLKKIVYGAMMKRKVRRRKRRRLDIRTGGIEVIQGKVKKIYRRWKEEKVGKERFLEEKKKFKELVEKKQNEKRKKEEELKKIKNEVEILKYINKKRGKKRRKTR